jgi:16S rRNA (uracil1498-N3)-methyltransferase
MPQVRIYIQDVIKKNKYIYLEKQNIHYLKNVMRKKSGDNILVFNDNEEWLSKCFFGDEIKLNPEKLLRIKENDKDIWICFGLVKTRNIDFLVEKVSEIGVKKILPMITSFSNRIPLNYERLKKISIEAVEQSNSLNLPLISKTMNIKKILNDWEEDRLIIFCDEKKGIDISEINRKEYNFKKIAIFIGPIGGWSEEDRKLINKKNNLRINLGSNIMKADTAAIFSLSIFKGYLL